MPLVKYNSFASKQRKCSPFLGYICCNKGKFWAILLFLIISVIGAFFYYIHYYNNKFFMTLFSFETFNSAITSLTLSNMAMKSTITSTSTTTTSTMFEIIVDMDDRIPSFKLATQYGNKPSIDGAETKLIEILRLYEKCKQDPSTIVVDVRANSGVFGLYAAACQCTVHMFEIEPIMLSLIRSSIKANEFSSSSVYLYNKAVCDLSYNDSYESHSSFNGTDFSDVRIEFQTIRLDDISWASPIFLLKIDFDGYELDILRSAEKLFREKRIRHLILHYNSVDIEQSTKEELLEHLRNVLRPKLIYLYHPTEKLLYGPLNNIHLKQLPNQQDKQRSVIGLYAVFDNNINRGSIKAKPYNLHAFFT